MKKLTLLTVLLGGLVLAGMIPALAQQSGTQSGAQ